MNINLGKLEKINLREVWKTEAEYFTPWLAQDENIQLLGDAIGIELEVEGTEKNVGPFRADILCKDTATGAWVLIENQLEKTDHSHLGQILTYAAGLSAVTIIWIAEKFTEEHRAALDWLNEITNDTFNFFGLEIELWKIENSPSAPKFNIVSKPNSWTRTISNVVRQIELEELSETKRLQLEYWKAFESYLVRNSKVLKPQKPLPQNWTNFSIGRSNFVLNALINNKDKRISVRLVISGAYAKEYFRQLEAMKYEIETEAKTTFFWRELPEGKESHIVIDQNNVMLENNEEWTKQHEWLKEHLELMHKVFFKRIKNLKMDN
ncbi:DUF4268 domain-containing protein [Clostridium thailandense]|uniref:DUF4268 domain-containing protein n=1 Tax=Clostridium thailandense TaxID=2794346 RepID=UPI003989F27D